LETSNQKITRKTQVQMRG